MKRMMVLGIAALFLVLGAFVVSSVLRRPNESESRLARGRSQLFTQNYLAALKTLRDIPDSQNRNPETHSYLGAAYLKLHLYKAAIKEFEEAIKAKPKGSDPWIGLASSYIELGDIQQAIDQAKRATEIEKRSPDAWLALGRAQWQQRNFDQAEQAALKAREIDPDASAVTDLLLHIYFDENDTTKFRTELDRVAKPSRPTQDLAVQFYVRQGQFAHAYDLKVRYDRDMLDRSILETELALKRDAAAEIERVPQFVKNLVKVGRYEDAVMAAKTYKGNVALDLELGKAYWMTGRKEEAVQAYERASAGRIHKVSAEIALAAITGDIKHWQEAYRAERIEQDYFVLARIEEVLPKADALVRAFAYRYAGLFDPIFYNNAAQEALKVLNDDPKNFDALMTIGTAYQRLGKIEDATRYIELGRDAYPKNAEPPSRLSSLAMLNPKPDTQKIITLMEAAVKLAPDNASYLYNLGWAYDQTGETAKATELYQRAIKASPLSYEAMNNLALIYSNNGQPEKSLPLLEQAMRTDPENESVYANTANYYAHRREWKQALENYERALEINPASSVAAVEKGRIYLEEGKTEEAVDNLSQALEVDPHSFDAYMLLSSAYEKMGHTKEAIAAVEEAQRVRPDAADAKAALDRLTRSLSSK